MHSSFKVSQVVSQLEVIVSAALQSLVTRLAAQLWLILLTMPLLAYSQV